MTSIPSRSWLGILLLLDAAGLGWVSLILFRISMGSERALLLGLSAQSLLLIGLTLLAALGFLAASLLVWAERLKTFPAAVLRRPAWSIGLLTTIAIAAWLLAWTPAEQFGRYYYYALRLIPLAGWLSFACGTFGLYLLITWRGIDLQNGRAHLQQNRAGFAAGSAALLAFALIGWLASQRIVGMNPQEEDFWYGAGVPVLAWQVLAAILIGWGAAWGEKKFLHNGTKQSVGRVPVDVLVFIFLWAAAGLLWAQAPIASNFLVSQPYPPNFEYYPAADGENYDLASQYALVGQGLFNGGQMRVYLERPLYPAFLFYLHLLAGQDFGTLLNLQAFLYGVLPALAYLIGKNLHSRAAGVMLAVLLTLRGVNGLETGGVLDNATQKMFLTEFPAAIGLALIVLLAIRWAQQPKSRWPLAGWMGGCIGLWGLARPHIVFLLPAAVLLAVGLYFRQKRSAAALAGLVVLAYLAAVLPWVQFNGSGMSLLSIYLWRAQAIIQERFYWPQPSPDGSLAPRQVASLILPAPPLPQSVKPLSAFALDHLLNNLTLSVLSLPLTLKNFDLDSLLKQETFWKPYWDGALSPSAQILLPIHLILLGLGIGLAWQRARLIGLFPLFGMLIYFGVNNLTRTSGGRYLVPADWVVMVYYVLGLSALFEMASAWLGGKILPEIEVQSGSEKPLWQGVVVLALAAGMGSVIPLAGCLHPQRYERLDKFQAAAKIEQSVLSQIKMDAAEIQALLAQEQAVAVEGRALYPRYIWRGINPLIPGHLLQSKPYSRMTFMILGAGGHQPVILVSGDEWYPLPNASDAIVLGCQEDGFLNAWGVYLPESGAMYLRQPETPLRCPLPEPICDNNGWCRYE